MSETNIENEAAYARRVAQRADAGVSLLIAFVLVYIAAAVVVFLDLLVWRPE